MVAAEHELAAEGRGRDLRTGRQRGGRRSRRRLRHRRPESVLLWHRWRRLRVDSRRQVAQRSSRRLSRDGTGTGPDRNVRPRGQGGSCAVAPRRTRHCRPGRGSRARAHRPGFWHAPARDRPRPAIRYAEEGFPVGRHLAAELAANSGEIRRHPALAAVYLLPTASRTPKASASSRRTLPRPFAPRDRRSGGLLHGRDRRADCRRGGRGRRNRRRGRPPWLSREAPRPLVTRYRGLVVVGAPPPARAASCSRS